MGRLFWKFFLFIWLAQLVGIVGVGTYFWYERNQAPRFAEGPPFDHPEADQEHPPPPPRFGDAPQWIALKPVRVPSSATTAAIRVTGVCRWRRSSAG